MLCEQNISPVDIRKEKRILLTRRFKCHIRRSKNTHLCLEIGTQIMLENKMFVLLTNEQSKRTAPSCVKRFQLFRDLQAETGRSMPGGRNSMAKAPNGKEPGLARQPNIHTEVRESVKWG